MGARHRGRVRAKGRVRVRLAVVVPLAAMVQYISNMSCKCTKLTKSSITGGAQTIIT